jgi:hypothetical protein
MLGAGAVAGIGDDGERGVGGQAEIFLRLLGDGVERVLVVALLGDFHGSDEVVLVIDGGLDVVADGGFAAFAQLAAVRVGEVDLPGGALRATGLMPLEDDFAFPDFVELAAEFLHVALLGAHGFVGFVGFREGGGVAVDGLVDAFNQFGELGLGEAARGAVDGFDEGAIDGDEFLAE